MEYPITVPLGRLITVGEVTYSELVFDEPDLGTSIAVEEAETSGQQTLILLAGMAGVSLDVIRKVKESDFRLIGERVLNPYQEEVRARMKGDAGNGKKAA